MRDGVGGCCFAEIGGLGNLGGQFQRLAEGGEAGEVGGSSFHGGERCAEEVVEVVGDVRGIIDGIAGDRDSTARVGFDDVDRVVAPQEGEAVPEEAFIRRFHRLRRFIRDLLNVLLLCALCVLCG